MINAFALRVSAIVAVCLLPVLAGVAWLVPGPRPVPSPPADTIKKALARWQAVRPGERIYLQTDKPLYYPGETIWFSAFLAGTSGLTRPAVSEILYVEVLGPKGNLEKKFSLIARGGKANGDFSIPPDFPGGVYTLKAYTRWMQAMKEEFARTVQVQELILPEMILNMELDREAYKSGDPMVVRLEARGLDNQPLAGAELRFTILAEGNTLQESSLRAGEDGKAEYRTTLPPLAAGVQAVVNVQVAAAGRQEAISRLIPRAGETMLVGFFPEGGDALENTRGRLAFRVMKSDSTPADAAGWLVDGKGNRLQYVKTFHKGTGSFFYTPKTGESYFIEWETPLAQRSALPLPLEKGFALSARRQGSGWVAEIRSSFPESFRLVARMRGKWLWDKTITVRERAEVSLPDAGWPAGVVSLGLFDSKGLIRAERLVFVRSERRLSISLKSDRERYTAREKAVVQVRVSDERGLPAPGQVLVSVVNEPLLSYTDNKQAHIMSSLLLEQELQTRLPDPDFYFGQDAKAPEALDLVLLTYGWRGIPWKKILEEEPEDPGVRPELARIAGRVLDASDSRPMRNLTMVIGKTTVTTDSLGRFRFPFIDLSRPRMLVLKPGGGKPEDQHPLLRYDDQMEIFYRPYVVMHRMLPEAAMAADVKAEALPPQAQGGLKRRVPIAMQPAVPPRAREGDQKKAAAGAPLPRAGRRAFRQAAPDTIVPAGEGDTYYAARLFPALPPPKSENRTDFRTTLFWSGIADLDNNGRASFSFFTGDDLSTYRIQAEAMGVSGYLGEGTASMVTELPFSVSARVPVEINQGDVVRIPVTLRNRTREKTSFSLEWVSGKALEIVQSLPTDISLAPGETRELPVEVRALTAADTCPVGLVMKKGTEADRWTRTFRIVPRGYPVAEALSGREMSKAFLVNLKNRIAGSLRVHASVYPDVTSDLLAGVESILAEPFGCFEQTSMTSYPNVLVLNYLRETGTQDPALEKRAEALLEKGYKKLTGFETKEKGYEWFGGTPAHEALTAYGLLQFREMEKMAPYVDRGMIERTEKWLLSRRDGKGGFLRSSQALDNFGRASDEITNAYIVYSLAEAGSQQIDEEIRKTTEVALQRKDPYLLALAANTLWLVKKNEKAREVTAELLRLQAENGSWTGLTHSITYSTGEALTVETTGFALLALVRSENPDRGRVDRAVRFLCDQRKSRGGFGNSQATIVALKALTAYVVFAKVTPEDGSFTLLVNGREAGKKSWKAGQRGAIRLEGWESLVQDGENRLEIQFSGMKEPLPFTLGLEYHTSLPPSDPACALELTTSLPRNRIAAGVNIPLVAELRNKTAEGLPMTMACIAIPAGCQVSPVELSSLTTRRLVDFYETRGNRIFLYFRQMAPKEVKKITINLSPILKGRFQASASSAYLYYTAERKNWASGLDLVIE
jgi:hypothetical protein